jgi:DNA-binding transcriptional regulator YiaG
MPNIATVLKAEISRVARKELRGNTNSLKKTVAAQRSEIASLKQRVQALEGVLKRLTKGVNANQKPSNAPVAGESSGNSDSAGLRFRAAGMATNRKRLGLSAADFGLLVGTTGQSIYAWEAGKSKPRPQTLAAIAALRGVGRRQVQARLAEMKGEPGSV